MDRPLNVALRKSYGRQSSQPFTIQRRLGIIVPMKQFYSVAAALVALALAGCAGSGSSSSSNKAVGATTEPRVEAVVRLTQADIVTSAQGKYSDADLLDPTKIQPSDLVDPLHFGIQDPFNIQASEDVYFELVNYTTATDGTITRHILPSGNWTVNDSTGLAGSVAVNSGLFTAGAQQTTSTEAVTAYVNGVTYGTNYGIKPRQVRLIGKVLGEDATAIMGVTVDFYAPQDPNDATSPLQLIGQVKTAYDGSFRASVPTYTNVTLQLENATVPAKYWRSFTYNGVRYDTGTTLCTAPVPASLLQVGERNMVDTSITDITTNGTIVLAPKSAYSSLPTPDPCS